MKLQEALAKRKFVVTAEIAPPKGTDVAEVTEMGKKLKRWVHAVNVTDQQSSTMRLGSMAVCHLLQEQGVDTIYQLTCRDRNRIALQSDLLSAHVLGLRNVLALTGDLPELGDHYQAKQVYDIDSVHLLEAIAKLNDGFDMAGNPLKGKTELFPGAVVNPGADTEAAYELQLIKFEKKVEAGAKFFQTQAIFDVETLNRFMKRVSRYNVPILAGIVPLKSAGMARFMNMNIPGIHVPDNLIQQMAQSEDEERTGNCIAGNLVRQFKPYCQGVHLMTIGRAEKVPAILKVAGL
ncbi:MAG: 5,10-methylenetetrahydrofolate reductase [Dehalococcoidia bacterium]|nr:MAG: 5,10-methylenetetrahydrofolate reductase [Dehalococcoidia bacterium]